MITFTVLHRVQFGVTTQSVSELCDNLHSSLAYLCTKFPGNFANVKVLNITVGLKTKVPLYVSTGEAACFLTI